MKHSAQIGWLLLLAIGLAAPAEAAIVVYVDQQGRRVYVNTEDREMVQSALRGGADAALRLMDRRRATSGIEEYAEGTAHSYGLDPRLVKAVIEVESAWNPRARSPKGALGLMQLMPATASRLGVHDPFDPRENVQAGVRHLRALLDRFGDLQLALAAYNAGENLVAAKRRVPRITETQQYVARITALYGQVVRSPNSDGFITRAVENNGRVVFSNF